MAEGNSIAIRESGRRGSSPLLAVLPGLRDLVNGRRTMGGFILFTLVFLLIVLVTSADELAGGIKAGRTDMWLAGITLFGTLVALWGREIRAALRPSILVVKKKEISPWSITAAQFKKNRLATAGLCCMLFLYLVALLAPLIAPYDPNLQEDIVNTRYLAPSMDHPMGTDKFGRDIFSRVIYGSRISLSIGFIAVGISITLGSLVGAVAGYAGGRTDNAIMRVVDMLLSFPRLVLIITVVALFTPSIFLLVAVLGATGWMGTSRIVRGQVLALREQEFVQAVRALGLKDWRILLFHVLPNSMAPIIVSATLGIGNTILLEAGLSFLGLGVQPPTASWGNIINDGRGVLLDAWWIATFPGLAIVITVICFNLLGDGLRDALDPRLRD
jgi:peptide/nickel transport system permease protein